MARYAPYFFFVVAIGLFTYPVLDTDLWWHIRVGEYIVDTQSIPYLDWLSFSMDGYAYVFHSWLTEVFLYFAHSIMGMWGVSLFYAALLAIGLFFSAITSSISRYSALFISLFTAPFVVALVGVRTQVATYVLATVLFYVLVKAPSLKTTQDGFFSWLKTNRLFVLLPLFALWGNLHGGVVLGLVLLGMYLGSTGLIAYWEDKDARKLVAFAVYSVFLAMFCAVCSGFNPYGFGQLTQAIAMQTNSTALNYNSDWYGLFQHVRGVDHYNRDLIIMGFGILGLLSARYASNARRVWLMLGSLLLLSFITMRFGLLVIVVATPLLIPAAHKVLQTLRDNMFIYSMVMGSAAFVLIGSFLYHFSETVCANMSEECYVVIASKAIQLPASAVQYMREYGVPQRLLNHYSHGGYLHYSFPNHQFFIDGRMDNFFIDGRSFAEEYFDLIHIREGWEEKFTRYRFDGYLGRKEWPLTNKLLEEGWRLVNEDEVNVLLLPPVDSM